jgi:hypothetical protein
MWLKLIIGGVNFGWLAAWVPSPDWLRRRSDCCQALMSSHRAWGGVEICLITEKITENLNQGGRKLLGCSAPNTICFVDLAIAGDGLD